MTYQKTKNPIGFYSASPLPSAEELSKFYAEVYFQNSVSSTYSASYDKLEIDYKRIKARALVELALQHRPAFASFLDIGAGEGFLLKAAHDQGCTAHGVDFSTFGVKSFHPELLAYFSEGDVFDFLERSKLERRFDVCSAINVLEHVIDPVEFMMLLRANMSDRGIALITVPNDYSPLQEHLLEQRKIDREFWFAPPQHLHYFNARTLVDFCQSQDFKVLDMVADFPIDLFLLNPAANYVMNPAVGKNAHRARMETDLLIIEQGYEKYLAYYRAMAAVGLGRDLTVVLSVADA